MTYITYPHINLYSESIIEDRDFLEIRAYAEEHDVPIMKVESKEFLKTILRMKKPESILEIGTAIGYSALIFDKYTEAKITTIELEEANARKAIENFKKYNADINLINDDARKALNNINQGFDFVFIDANKAHYEEYFEQTAKMLNPNGIIIADNVLFKGMVANDDLLDRRMITIVKRLRNFIAYVLDRDDFTSSLIPIGDGLTLSIKEK